MWLKWQREDQRLASPFLAPEFAVAFGHHHEEARVAIVEDDHLVALFPFEHHRFQLGRSFAFDLSDSQAILCSKNQAFDPMELLAGCGFAVWEFDHLVSHQAPLFDPRHVVIEPAPVIDLRDGYEIWLEKKRKTSHSRMKKVLQKTRKSSVKSERCSFSSTPCRKQTLLS